MSAGDFWDSLAGRLADVAVWIEVLRTVGLWVCLLLLPAYCVALIVWLLNRLSGEADSAEEPSPFKPAGLRQRLDNWAGIRIAQRTRRQRGRRHSSAREQG